MLLDHSRLISALFRETDRAQRMKTPLALIQIGIEQSPAPFPDESDRTLDEFVGRTTRLLRSYDLIGALDGSTFLVVLPGCDATHAALLAERLKAEIFYVPVRAGERTRPDACFGVVSSGGRSPLVVMRDAERALQRARKNGLGSIEFFTESTDDDPASFPRPDLPLETKHQ